MKAVLAILNFLNGVISFHTWLRERRGAQLLCSLLWFVSSGIWLSCMILEAPDEEEDEDESSDYAD